MIETSQKESERDLPFIKQIVDIHVLTTGILSATILFLLLRYNKNFDRPRLKLIITAISLCFCFLALIISAYAVLVTLNHHKIKKKNKMKMRETLIDNILDKLPFIISTVLLIISLLLFYTVELTSFRLFFEKIKK